MVRKRWKAQPFQAFLVRALAFLLPVAAAVAIAILVSSLLPEPSELFGYLGWWIAVVGTSLGVMVLVDRLARRLLPLAALLRLALHFPDQAPSRFRLALRSGSTGQLHSQVAAARARGRDDEPTRAAEFVLTLVAALGAHDRKTRGHAERTRAYTDLLAEELKLSREDRERLRWAALLHDVGKMAIQAEVLNKDGNLEEVEWSEIRQHPADGFELSRPLHEFLGGWETTILHHHEKWDGTGYPFGLRGEDIAFGARVVAVGDAYDAMTALRSYQPAMSSSAARQELATAAGQQFDPVVVRAFLNLSMGSLRKVMGVGAVLAQLPFVGGLRRMSDTAGLLAAGVASLLAFVVAGMIPSPGIAILGGDGDLLAAGSVGGGGVVTVDVPAYLNEIDSAFLQPAPESEGRVLAADAIDPATIQITEPPGSGTAVVAGDTIVYTPGPTFGGSDTMQFSVCDVSGVCAVAPLTITAGGVTTPVVVAAGGLVAGDGQPGDDQPGGAESSSTGVPQTSSSSTSSSSTLPPATSSTTTSTASPSTTSTTSPPTTTSTASPSTTSTTSPPTTSSTSTSTTTTTSPPTTSSTSTSTTSTTTTSTTTTSTTSTTTTSTTTTTTTTTAAPDPAPVARADAAVTDEDAAITIAVLDNDTDPNGDIDPATLAVTEGPQFGTAAAASGEVVYTPLPDANGVDEFTYQICDATARCDSAVVSVTVVSLPDPPRVVDDTAATLEDESVVVDVLGNDSDVDDDLDPATLTIVSGPALGEVSVESGALRYVPAQDAFGFDVMAYEVCDATGLCGQAVVSVEIEAVADAPVAVDDAFTGERNSPLSIDLLANDYDPDGGLPALVGASPVTALGGRVFCGTACVYLPPTPWTGPDTFTYTIIDADGLTATGSVTITPDVADLILYMRQTIPGDQVASPVLPLSADPGPSNDILPNFDTDRDDNPGLFLLRVDNGVGEQLAETDPSRYQIWSIATAEDLVIEGLGELSLWAATSQFQPDVSARVTAFILDCPQATTDGTECRALSRGFVDRRPWTVTSGAWQNATIDFGRVAAVVPAGHTLAIKLTVAGPNSDDDMHFAFDAEGFDMSFSVLLTPSG